MVYGTDGDHLSLGLLEHLRIDVDGKDVSRGDRRGLCAPAITAAQIGRIPARLDPERKDYVMGIRPERLPPIGVEHRCCREDRIRRAHRIRFVP